MNRSSKAGTNVLQCKALSTSPGRNEFYIINDSLLYNLAAYQLNKNQTGSSENFDTLRKTSFLEVINTDVVFFNLLINESGNKSAWKIDGLDVIEGYYEKMVEGWAYKE